MIKTNLLPPELQGKKRKSAKRAAPGGGGASSPVGFGVLALALGVVFLLVAGLSAYQVYGKITTASELAKKNEKALDKAKKKYKAEYSKYETELLQWNLLNDKKEILETLMPEDRLLWSEKLNMLSALTPEGVFVTDLEVTESVKMIETKGSIERRKAWEEKKKVQAKRKKDEDAGKKTAGPKVNIGKKPKEVKKPIITQTLILDAVTPWDEEGGAHRERYIEFQKQMQTFTTKNEAGEVRVFKDQFKLTEDGKNIIINPGVQEKKDVDGVPVWAFQVTLTTQPFFDPNE
jgi:hypothetical protein